MVDESNNILRAARQSDSKKIEPAKGKAKAASRPQISAVASASSIVLRGVSSALNSIKGNLQSTLSKIQKE